ncbi:YbaK/EbsC family protein [Desulfolutivibrio sp.]|uniref:YbaK/EbsC family protein n=1 Tax=Desulfolutivibrio sp. TaxID=2773296 RepID=UPI002F9678FA
MLKAKDRYYLVVTTCDWSIKARHFKKPFGTKDIRFAKPDEIEAHSGCGIGSRGSLPPFLPGNMTVAHYFDLAILASENFMFYLAANTISVRMKSTDLYKLLTVSGTKAVWFSRNLEERLDFFHHEELPRLRLSPPPCV